MTKFIHLLSVSIFILALLSCGGNETDAKTENLKSVALEFIEAVLREDYSTAVAGFDSTMQEALPPEELENLWGKIISQVGPFKKQVSTRTEESQGYDIVYVTCEFERFTFDIKIVFNSDDQIAGLFFVPAQSSSEYERPAYSRPDSFYEKEVAFGSSEWSLPGTLCIPAGVGPFPAVVLVHGSGPHDRDETVGPNKPFRDLAEGLASRGIAVLRYEKRTKVHADKIAGIVDSLTVKEETIDDALAAVALLRGVEEVDPGKIFVAGHSLGGTVIPRIAGHDGNVAGFIIMAGSTRLLEDLIYDQISYLFSLDDSLSESDLAQLEQVKTQVARVKELNESAVTPPGELPLGIPAAYWLDLRGYNPAEEARKITKPVLILHGGRDYQVTMEDFHGWKKSLSSKSYVTFKLYPDLNHLFMTGEGKSTPAEYDVPGHVSGAVIEDIVSWIKNR
jgi:dienelactone hydrolase